MEDNKIFYVLVLLIALGVGGGIYAFSTKSQQEGMVLATATPAGQDLPDSSKLTTVEELKKEDIKVGTGAEAVTGKLVTVHYTGTLTDGTKFDSSLDRGQPFSFTIGQGDVIQGWDLGVAGMKVGGKRKLTIPSDMAYGDAGVPGAIPGGATLVFEIELLKVE